MGYTQGLAQTPVVGRSDDGDGGVHAFGSVAREALSIHNDNAMRRPQPPSIIARSATREATGISPRGINIANRRTFVETADATPTPAGDFVLGVIAKR